MSANTASFAPINVRNPRTGERDYLLKPATPDEVASTADRLRMNQPAWLTWAWRSASRR